MLQGVDGSANPERRDRASEPYLLKSGPTAPSPASPAPRARSRAAFGLIEGLVALAIFMAVFLPLLEVFTGTGASQMVAVRDYAAALNVAERLLENGYDLLEAGRVESAGELDMTPWLETDEAASRTLQGARDATARMTIAPVAGRNRLFRLDVELGFGDRPRRSLTLSGYKYAPDC